MSRLAVALICPRVCTQPGGSSAARRCARMALTVAVMLRSSALLGYIVGVYLLGQACCERKTNLAEDGKDRCASTLYAAILAGCQ